MFQAAYNVGGHTVNVDMIQSSILGCRLFRPGQVNMLLWNFYLTTLPASFGFSFNTGFLIKMAFIWMQWLWQLFSSKTKFKVGDGRKAYSIDHPEPRLYFALCAGSYSDPAVCSIIHDLYACSCSSLKQWIAIIQVRVYTPKRVFEDLEAAKEEYIQSTFIVHKEKKLHIPKIVDSFAKDLELCPAGVVEMIEHLLPNGLRKRIQECRYRKYGKNIEWIPHNFAFRYLLSKELA